MRLLCLLLAVIVCQFAVAQEARVSAKSYYDLGATAFGERRYSAAAEFFGHAYRFDPGMLEARTKQGHSEMMQFVPGKDSPDNTTHAELAIEAFLEVLDRRHDDEHATKLIAELYFFMKRFDEASAAHERLLILDPSRADSHYTIGVVAWTRSYGPRLELRAKLGLKPDDPGPIPDSAQRRGLTREVSPILENGLEHLRQAMLINPDHGDAMAYANLIELELADLSESLAEHDEHIRRAEDWLEAATAVRRLRTLQR